MPVRTASATGRGAKKASDELIVMGAGAAAAQAHITESTATALQAGTASKRQQQSAAKALASVSWRPATTNVATSTATTASSGLLAAPLLQGAGTSTYITSATQPRINHAVFASPVVAANHRVLLPGASAFTSTPYRPVGSYLAAPKAAGVLRASSLGSSVSSHTSMYGPDALRADDRMLGGWLRTPHTIRMMRADLERLPRRQQQLVWFLGLFVLPIVLSLVAERVFIGPGHGSGQVHPLRDGIPTWGQATTAASHAASREFAWSDWLWPHRAAARIYDYAFGGGRCAIGDRKCIATEYRWNPIMRLPGWIADTFHGTRVAADFVLDGISGAAHHVLWAFGLQRAPKPFTVRAEEKLNAAARRVRGDATRVTEGVKGKVCDAAGCVADVMRGAASDVKETATDFRKEVKRAAESIGRDANDLRRRLI